MNIRQKIYLLLTALALVVVWLFCWFIEALSVLLSTYPQGYFVGLLIGIAIAYPTLRRTSTRQLSAVLLASFAIALMGINLIPPWQPEPVKSYMMFYKNVHPGMNLVAVQRALDQRFPSSGALPKPVCHEKQPEPARKIFSCSLDPNQGNYNAEFVTIYFKDDRVIAKDYSPD